MTDATITLIHAKNAKPEQVKHGVLNGKSVTYTNKIVGVDESNWRTSYPLPATFVASGLSSQFARTDSEPQPKVAQGLTAQQLFDKRRGRGAFESRWHHSNK